MRKTGREKLEAAQERKVVDDPRGRGRMLVPRPLDVDALIRQVPRGKLVTVTQVRERLARDFQADFTCPLCGGIFLRISAEAAEEDRAQGKADIAPYWRVVRDDGSLNDKFPGGTATQAARLQEEGYTLLSGQGKKSPRVRDWESFLLQL